MKIKWDFKAFKEDCFMFRIFFSSVPIPQATLSWLESNVSWHDRKNGGQNIAIFVRIVDRDEAVNEKGADLGCFMKLNKLKFASVCRK